MEAFILPGKDPGFLGKDEPGCDGLCECPGFTILAFAEGQASPYTQFSVLGLQGCSGSGE